MEFSAGQEPPKERRTDTSATGEPMPPTRREAGRRLLTAAVVTLAPLITASRPHPTGPDAPVPGADAPFDETYLGRRIRGAPVALGSRAAPAVEWQVTVDGRPLHLMRRADGSWLSMVDHYGWYRTPLEATRAAVDELGPRGRLRDLAPGPLHGGHPHREAPHGVRA
ncbi:tyrosinase family oxidase copper chaperone [Streptomyces sp. NPDC059852]|uniref:tyrosinase family oxidase copper chaperone n=1 Tax=Streptomyces sp. NPDC059852 TaxID=3346972 RepID=UPI003649B14F